MKFAEKTWTNIGGKRKMSLTFFVVNSRRE